MKLILVCTSVVLLMTAVELVRSPRRMKNTIQKMYREANATPVPEMILEVDFRGLEVTFGMEISPAEIMDVPCIEFDSEPGCYYTVIGIGPDCPIPDDPYLSPCLFVLYVNVYTNSDGKLMLEDSGEIASWIAVGPPPGSGRHRLLLYVYEQKEMIDTTNKGLRRSQFLLFRFQLSLFVKTFDLISPPIAGTMWYTEYPLYFNVKTED